MDDTAYALYRKGTALLSEGMLREAAHAFEQARSLEPEKASIREALARACFGLGRTGDAIEEFEAAAAIEPTNDFAHFGLALCFERQGKVVEARGHLRLALAMRPDREDYLRVLGRLDVAATDPGSARSEESPG